MDSRQNWDNKHQKYAKEEWINKPTLFSQFVINYFPKSGKILDLGTGQGQDARFFSNYGYDVVATDYSEVAINLAKHNNASFNINYLVHDLQDRLPFEDQSFDIVYSHLSIQFFDNQTTDNIFKEINRVLKVNGILAIMVNTKNDPEIVNSKFISEDLYETPSGLIKRFYDEKSLLKFTENKFETILIDSKGETYKDEIKTLIRYIGKKTV